MTKRLHPPTQLLRAFVTTAQLGTISAAADTLEQVALLTEGNFYRVENLEELATSFVDIQTTLQRRQKLYTIPNYI